MCSSDLLRRFKPSVVLCNAVFDRHPDHGRAGKLVAEACYLSGLLKIVTEYNGVNQLHWRPKSVHHYIQDFYLKPDFVVDITGYQDQKIAAVLAYKTQFYNPGMEGPETPISSKHFLDVISGRMKEFGRLVHVDHGEGFLVSRPLGVQDITTLL